MSDGRIHQVNVSGGGVPKRARASARVTRAGLEGDAFAKPQIHGAPHQAVSLFALERIEALAAEGHPIAPGSTGENVTTRGLDWDRLAPGARLRLGADVVLEITGYAAPCRTIAGSFTDERTSRVSQAKAPGWSRLYAAVLSEGDIRPGDPVRVERNASTSTDATTTKKGVNAMRIAYVNVHVTDFDRSLAFFGETLGLPLQHAHREFGYASFDAGPVRLGIARIDPEDAEARALVGGQTGVGFGVADLEARHRELAARGVAFPMPPARQPWGGFMALFSDPDGNVFYLDELTAE